MRLHRNWVILAAALVIGAGAALTAMRYLDDRVADIERRVEQRTARAVVAKEDMGAGEAIDHARVAVRDIPVEWLHSSAISPEQFDRAAGAVLGFPARRGEPLLWSQLQDRRPPTLSARLAPGRRAVTLSVDEISSIAGLLEPGDVVDLLLTVRRNQENLSVLLLQDVAVLAAGARTVAAVGQEGAERRYSTVTLEASAEEAQRIVAGRTVGTITAVLRGPGDRAKLPPLHRDALALLGLEKPLMRTAPPVPVIYGGNGAPAMRTPLPEQPEDLARLGRSTDLLPTATAEPAASVLSGPISRPTNSPTMR